MSSTEKKPSFLYRVGIARLIAFIIIIIVVIIGTYAIKPDQVQAPGQPSSIINEAHGEQLGTEPIDLELLAHGETGNVQWRLVFLGIGPTESGQPMVAETTYVFEKATHDFPALHFFIPYEVRVADEVHFEGFEQKKGNEYFFSGAVKFLDAAAGNRWYEATDIDELKPIIRRGPGPEKEGGAPTGVMQSGFTPLYAGELAEWTIERIEEQIDRRNYCEVDSDCEAFYGECPFGCHNVVNRQFVQPAQQLISDRRAYEARKGNPQCVYGCMQLSGVQCKEQKCSIRTFLPSHASRPAAVDDEDLERFREHPGDTREILQERRKIVDDYLNGVADYQDCQLSDNGKYVVCIDEDNIVSINLSTGATTTSTESNYRINVSG